MEGCGEVEVGDTDPTTPRETEASEQPENPELDGGN